MYKHLLVRQPEEQVAVQKVPLDGVVVVVSFELAAPVLELVAER